MKKTVKAVMIIAVIAVLATVLFSCKGNESKEEDGFTVNTDTYSRAEGHFHYDVTIDTEIKEEDLKVLKELFNGKRLNNDAVPSCGFSEDISIVFDDTHVFQLGQDRCGTIYCVDKDAYFDLSDSEAELMFEVLEKYGFHFPCV